VVALLDVLIVDCIPARLSDCCAGLVVGTKVGNEVMDIEGRAGDVMYLWNESVNYQLKIVQHVGLQCLQSLHWINLWIVGHDKVLQVQQFGLAVH